MSIIDFEDSLADLAKSEGGKGAKGAIAKLGLPSDIPGIGPVADIIDGFSKGSAKGIVGASGTLAGGVLGSVFGGPVGGKIGSMLGGLLSEVVPKTAKEQRIHREASRTKNDIKALAANPVTDKNLIERFDRGNIIVGLSIGTNGKDVPGSQNPKEYKYYRFPNGKKEILTREQLLPILAKDKTILQTGSNIVGHKLLEAYKQLKAAKNKVTTDAIAAATKATVAKKTVTAKTKVKPPATKEKSVSDTVKDVLTKAGIDKDLKAVIDNQKKQAKSVEKILSNIVEKQNAATQQDKDDHLTLGKMIKLAAERSQSTGDTVTALTTILQDSAAIPKKYQNLFGGKGFIKLVNKA